MDGVEETPTNVSRRLFQSASSQSTLNGINNSIHNTQSTDRPLGTSPTAASNRVVHEHSEEAWKVQLLAIQSQLINSILPITPKNNQTQILDLISIFRDFTSTGTITHFIKSMQHQLQTLSSTIIQAKQLTRTVHPAKAVPSSTPPSNQEQSYAQAATKAGANGQQKDNKQAKPKPSKAQNKSTSKKEETRSKQLILYPETPFDLSTTIALTTRDNINTACKAKGATSNVVASVESSRSNKSIILNTLQPFTAEYLHSIQEHWQATVPFKFTAARVNTIWHQVAIHGIPLTTHYNTNILDLVPNELLTFNQLHIIAPPRWLTSQEKRASGNQRAGSVIVAFSSKAEARKAISQRLHLFGISCRAEEIYNTTPHYRCKKCQRYGHSELNCRLPYTCEICAEPHSTTEHICQHCTVVGKQCLHSMPKCINCGASDRASHRNCATLLAITNKDPEQIL